MNVREQMDYIDKLAYVGDGKFNTLVQINDIKQSFGAFRYQVAPVLGKGSKWVEYLTVIDGDELIKEHWNNFSYGVDVVCERVYDLQEKAKAEKEKAKKEGK